MTKRRGMDDSGHYLPATEAKFKKALPTFTEWLAARGAQILAPTSEWELIRFDAKLHGTGIVYRNSAGKLSWQGPARHAWRSWKLSEPWRAEPKKHRLYKSRGKEQRIAALKLRDGTACFYCGEPLGEGVTPEEVFSRTHGGTTHIANQVLAHMRCNSMAGHLPVVEKVKLRERLQCAIVTPESHPSLFNEELINGTSPTP